MDSDGPVLPQDIITNILIRLPGTPSKALTRTSVTEVWQSMRSCDCGILKPPITDLYNSREIRLQIVDKATALVEILFETLIQL
ncbi:uncharacterized protein LOC129286702 isoform X2 [Prosopis cineraria]|uniref:uncharacterized protein LOC129286702 isoform X2 n=1 Tax=Prosopis cineraria TaxID=364024 RepID=UPI002410A7FC|nr:uncharacterized protein LOC129286702 isoform X2 [Prosopis cineraria]